MDRIIDVKVNGDYLSMDRRKAGNQHEANIARLRIHFDPNWDGLAKTVTFWDANGNHPVKRTLTADRLEDAAKDIRVYLCPIPGEALAESGMMTFTIDGYRDGVRQRTAGAELEVGRSPYEENAGEPADPTPSQAEQLQVQIDTMLGEMQEMASRAVAAAEAAEHARDASLEITGGVQVTQKDLEGKADLNHASRHKRGGADALVAADIGALSENFPYASDLLTVTKNTAVRTDSKTLNTPYKAGLTGYASGVCYVSYVDAQFSTLLYLSAGAKEVFLQVCAKGVRSAWTRLATIEDAVSKKGDTMTGALGVSIGGGNANLVADPACAYLQAFKDGTWDKRRTLLLRTKESAPDLTNVLSVATAGDETTGEYPVIHTGNLHLITPAAIGAARIEKGTYVGTGKAGSLYPNSLTFGFEPAVVMLGGYGVANGVVFFMGMTETSVYANSFSQSIKFALNGNTLTWYNASAGESESNTTRQMGQLNMLGETYTYIVLG